MQDATTISDVSLESVLDGIIAELDNAYDKYPRDAIAAARQHRDAIIPRLIAAIDRDVDEVRDTGEVQGQAGFYAVYLLAEFRAKEAVPSILRALASGDDAVDALFGDALFEDLPCQLADLIDDISVADSLIADDSLDWSIRNLGMHLYVQFVFLGRLSRTEAVERLRMHLRNMIAAKDGETATWLIGELVDLAALEALDEIREAYELDLVDETIFGPLSYVEAEMTPAGFAEKMSEIAAKREENLIDGIARWAWFAEKPSPPPWTAPETTNWMDDESDAFDDPGFESVPAVGTIRYTAPRVGRNDPCPCGSGRKFKKCCGGN